MTANHTDAGMMTLFLAGDVMTGRGIDQILPSSGEPRLHESYILDARTYVDLAEEASGRNPDTRTLRLRLGRRVKPAGPNAAWGADHQPRDRRHDE